MSRGEVVLRHLDEHATLVRTMADGAAEAIEAIAARVATTVRGNGTVFFCGNGGSAADAQHLAAEYMVRFQRERRPLAAVALTADTSVLTAGANDYGFENVFARQVSALARAGDLLVLHSTTGESENLLRAATAARANGVATVALLARGGGRLAPAVDQAFTVPTDSSARAQEMHILIGHIVCDLVDRELFDDEADG